MLIAVLTCPYGGSAQLYTLQTKNLRLVYYSKAHEFIVPHLAICFENSLRFHERLFDYKPSEEVTLILQDFGDFASGGANTVPFNLMSIGIAPFNTVYETMPPIERMSLMMDHEIAHIATMDKPSPSDRFFRSLFAGRVAPTADAPPSMFYSYLTAPRWNSPRWSIEGIAVFLETWMGGGLGRAQSAYDEMVFRTMVHDSGYFYDPVGLESEGTKIDFQVGTTSYLYGTRFVSYLALTYGPQKLLQWYTQSDSSSRYYATQFYHVYGRSLDDAWNDWIAWEHEWQRTNLDTLRRYPITQFRKISPQPLGSVSRAAYDPADSNLYVAVNLPGQTAHIASINIKTGEMHNLHNIRGGAIFYVSSIAYDRDSKTIFYTADNNRWRSLHALDLRSGQSRELIADARTGDLAYNRADHSLWGVRHYNGISTLVRIPYPYAEWNQILSLDYGQDLFDLDIAPDGSRLVAAHSDISGRQKLVSMNIPGLMKGDTTSEVLYDFENSTPANFIFSDDGRSIYGSTFSSGVSNIVRYDFTKKTMDWVTNGETGFFRPVPLAGDSLVAFYFTARGFEPVMIPNATVTDVAALRYLGTAVIERYPELEQWHLPPSSLREINLDSLTTYEGPFAPISAVRLASAYPVVEGYKDRVAWGYRFNIADPIQLHAIDLTLAVSPGRSFEGGEKYHARFNYRFWQWTLSGSYNGSDFYDLFGPTKLSRKGYSGSLQYRNYLIYEEPVVMDYTVKLSGYSGLEQLPEYQNVTASYDRFVDLSAILKYRNLGFTIGAVDNEYGIGGSLRSSSMGINGKLFWKFSGSLDYGFLLPVEHVSLWLRGSAGYSPGDRDDPFSNTYFGAFGNNWVDHQDIRRYREYYSFPGLALNEAGGTSFGKLTTELTLPALRFRRAGGQYAYCTWMRWALFGSVLVTNPDDEAYRKKYFDAGGQMDVKIIIFSSMETTFSLGYAIAAEEQGHLAREFMVSLKIL